MASLQVVDGRIIVKPVMVVETNDAAFLRREQVGVYVLF